MLIKLALFTYRSTRLSRCSQQNRAHRLFPARPAFLYGFFLPFDDKSDDMRTGIAADRRADIPVAFRRIAERLCQRRTEFLCDFRITALHDNIGRMRLNIRLDDLDHFRDDILLAANLLDHIGDAVADPAEGLEQMPPPH